MKILKLYSSHNRRREDVRRLRSKLRKDGKSYTEEVEGRFVLDNVIVETKTVGDKRLREGRWDAIIYQEDVVVEESMVSSLGKKIEEESLVQAVTQLSYWACRGDDYVMANKTKMVWICLHYRYGGV